MAIKFVKKHLNDYINQLRNTRCSQINEDFNEFVKNKFKEIIEPISSTLPTGDKIQKLAKQLSKALSEFEANDPNIRYSYDMPSSYRDVSRSIHYLSENDMAETLKEATYRSIINYVKKDQMVECLKTIEKYGGIAINRERASILFSECYVEFMNVSKENEAIYKITREALTIVTQERTAKKAYNILKGMDYPLDDFDKKMIANKPQPPAVYQFSEPVCKLTASCEE